VANAVPAHNKLTPLLSDCSMQHRSSRTQPVPGYNDARWVRSVDSHGSSVLHGPAPACDTCCCCTASASRSHMKGGDTCPNCTFVILWSDAENSRCVRCPCMHMADPQDLAAVLSCCCSALPGVLSTPEGGE
jgi:hypothetical protein